MSTLERVFAGKSGIGGLRSKMSNFFNSQALRNLEVQRGDLLYPPSIFCAFREPPAFFASTGDGSPTGSGGDENLMVANNTTWRYHIIGTQTIVKPVWASAASGGGLNIGMDQTNGDGVEFSTGVTPRAAFLLVAGTTAGYVEVDFTVADVSGLAEMAVGWRKAEAFQAAIDDYDEMACLNLQAGDVNIETILNGAATTTTDTTSNVTNAQQCRLRVEVDADRKVTYKVGAGTTSIAGPSATTPATVAAFTFDAGEYLVPFIHMKHNSDVAGDVIVQRVECGYL